MPIATFDALKLRITAPRQRVRFQKSAPATGVIARAFSAWNVAGLPPAGGAPGAAAVPTNASAAALGQADGTDLRVLRAMLSWTTLTGGTVVIADRLSHQSGLSGTTVGAQATNLPSAALTRKTSGIGVLQALEIYSVIGGTATTVTSSYTNTVPTSGRTAIATTIGATGLREAGQIVWMSLAPGDRGTTEVASVSLVASTVGAGDIGVSLLYPVVTMPTHALMLPMYETGYDFFNGFGGLSAVVENGAALQIIHHTNVAAPGTLFGELHFGED